MAWTVTAIPFTDDANEQRARVAFTWDESGALGQKCSYSVSVAVPTTGAGALVDALWVQAVAFRDRHIAKLAKQVEYEAFIVSRKPAGEP